MDTTSTRVEVAADARGGYVVRVKWMDRDDHERSIFRQANTHVDEKDLALAVVLACNARGYRDPFDALPKRGA